MHCIKCGNKTELVVPNGDNKTRQVCTVCGHIHYINPNIIVGINIMNMVTNSTYLPSFIVPIWNYQLSFITTLSTMHYIQKKIIRIFIPK